MKDQDVTIELSQRQIFLGGYLTWLQSDQLARDLAALSLPGAGALSLNLAGVMDMDTIGAWQVQQFIQRCRKQGYDVQLESLAESFEALFHLIHDHEKFSLEAAPKSDPWLTRVGKGCFSGMAQSRDYFAFVGQLWYELCHWIKRPRLIRWPAIAYAIELDGYSAIPIVALLSFLIGVVLAYQIGVQLRNYGANIYVVDLLGISVLREFAPLLTAIILAGRTGSAHTAQIGTMKLNEELDALHTFGLSPNSLIVLPKILALAVALPLLTILSEVFSIFGGMIMSNGMLGITFTEFLKRFGANVTFTTYLVGLIKTPVFAVLIASIGCFQGYRVTNSAESVGRHTTMSVVQGIFMIIVADAAFSILYTLLDI
jgi:phospholipid/cholesterol/gamma-HCH transport system permease protein